MNSTIYLVWWWQGEYADRSEDVVSAHRSREGAQAFIESLPSVEWSIESQDWIRRHTFAYDNEHWSIVTMALTD